MRNITAQGSGITEADIRQAEIAPGVVILRAVKASDFEQPATASRSIYIPPVADTQASRATVFRVVKAADDIAPDFPPGRVLSVINQALDQLDPDGLFWALDKRDWRVKWGPLD